MLLVLEIKNSINNYLKVLFLKSIAFQSKVYIKCLKLSNELTEIVSSV
jgi:hypothetical protein